MPFPAGPQTPGIALLAGWDANTLDFIKVTVDATGALNTAGGGGGGSTVDQGTGGASPWLVTGPLTDTQLRASAVPVSGTVTASGPLTDTQLRATAVPVSAGTNLNTSALALEGGGNLAAIKTDVDKIPSLGQALAASSVPVVLTAIQQTALTPPAAITGFALEAGHLATIDTSTAKIPSQGQALAANSVPVVLTAIQVAALTPPAAITGYALEAGHLNNLDAVAGTTAGAAVITDANATLQQYLRGLVKLAITAGSFLVTASLAAGTNLVGRVSASAETNTVYDGTTALTPKYAVIAAASNGNNNLVAAVGGKKLRVLGYNFIANGSVNAKFQSDGAGTPVDKTGLKYCVVNSGISVPFNPVGWFETASGKTLDLNLSAGVAVGGELVYVEV